MMARKSLDLHGVKTIRILPEVNGEYGTWREIHIFDESGDIFEIACFTEKGKEIEVEFVEE